MADRIIYHVDVNSAFLSWEACYRREHLGDEQDLRDLPSAVAGDKEARHGIILAKSTPAKLRGVKTGEPIWQARRKCPDLILVPANYGLYVAASRRFIALLKDYAPVVEQYSIDEAFVDVTGCRRLYGEPVQAAHKLKERIHRELGFTVNIGVSCNKLLAKMAGELEKPDKVHTLFHKEIGEKMWPLPVGELFTVGKATAERLREARIMTIGDLAHTDPATLEKMFGVKLGSHLHRYANGISNSPVLAEPEEAKGYSISTTLEDDIETADAACHILLSLADSVAARMRADDFKAFCVAVTIRSNDFKNKSHQQKLREPTDGTNEIYQIAKQLFSELWDGKTPLRLLGIALTDLTREDFVQTSLFAEAEEKKTKSKQLDKTVDALRSKYGRSAVQRGALLRDTHEVGKKYKAQMEEGKK